MELTIVELWKIIGITVGGVTLLKLLADSMKSKGEWSQIVKQNQEYHVKHFAAIDSHDKQLGDHEKRISVTEYAIDKLEDK